MKLYTDVYVSLNFIRTTQMVCVFILIDVKSCVMLARNYERNSVNENVSEIFKKYSYYSACE